jgi:PAS domain S-box-containing protein
MAKKVLLVEDEALLAMSEARMLEKHGYEVVTVYNGEKAVETADSDPDISLILMDIDLGSGIDGTEAAQKILKQHDLPIAFLSSHTEPEIVERTEGITSYGYIVKNSGETVLLASIRMAFRLYYAHLELKNQKENLRQALIKQEQIEEELLEKSAEFERYFSMSLDLLCIATTKGEFIRLNPEWEKVLGYPVSELEGRSFMDFVHEEDREPTLEAVSRLNHQREVRNFENRYRCKDGSYRWMEWRSRAQGETIYAVARDITERKRIEHELRESEEKFRTLIEQSTDMMVLHDLDGKILDVNKQGAIQTGYSREELLSMSIPDLDPDYYEREDSGRFWKSIGYNDPYSFKARMRRRDGSIFKAEVVLSKVFIGERTYIMTFSRDVQNREQNFEELQRSEARFRNLFNHIHDGVVIHDLHANILEVNESFSNRLGYGQDELKKMRITDINSPGYAELVPGRISELKSKKRIVFTAAHVSKQGEEIPLEIHSGIIEYKGREAVLSICRDITDRLKAEEALRSSKEKYRMLYEYAPIPYQSLDADGCVLEVNPAWCEALGGYSREEVLGKSFEEFLCPDYVSTFRTNLQEFKDQGVAENNVYEMRKKDGESIVCAFQGRAFYASDGRFQHTHCVFEDITEKNRQEQEAKKREVFYRSLMENSIDAVYLLSEEGKVLDVNQTACDMLGYTREELLELTIDAIDEHYPSKKFVEFWSVQPEGATVLFESTHVHKDGHPFPVEVNGIFFRHEGVKYLYGVARDVSERKKKERELRKLNKDFTSLAENASDMVARFDPQFRHLYVNKAMETLTGIDRTELIGKTPTEVNMPKKQARFVLDSLKAAAEALEEKRVEQEFPASVGGQWIETRIVPEIGEDGRMESILAISRDITESKRIEQTLRESEKQTKRILNSISDGIVVLDSDFRVVRTNKKLREDVGIEDEEAVVGKKCYAAFYGFNETCEWCPSRKVLEAGEEYSTTVPYPADNPKRWFHLLASPVYDDTGKITHVVESARDITSRMKTEQEKDELMKELNHRVKNNLLMISSLIRLKDDTLGTDIDLSDIERQITAIRIVHEKLYETENVSSIDMQDYLAEILTAVFSFYPEDVEKDIRMNTIVLDTKTAVSVGLIVNEIATNAVKHGFASGKKAKFVMEMFEDSQNKEYCLTLSNSGTALPEYIDICNPPSLGLQLINSLVGQLEGSIELKREPETTFIIRFPVEK